uniref:hypothetical protein n=1 Tax=Cupriavidus yeoncheonensis TaxID=1462994 RepID=UPI003F494545
MRRTTFGGILRVLSAASWRHLLGLARGSSSASGGGQFERIRRTAAQYNARIAPIEMPNFAAGAKQTALWWAPP